MIFELIVERDGVETKTIFTDVEAAISRFEAVSGQDGAPIRADNLSDQELPESWSWVSVGGKLVVDLRGPYR